MPFVEPPVLFLGNPHGVELVERDPERADRALEHGRVRDVEPVVAVAEQAPGLARFFATFLRQIDVGPPSESILFVPGALAVAQQNDFMHLGT